jgi:aerobic C4-dicarboxylate transport protein
MKVATQEQGVHASRRGAPRRWYHHLYAQVLLAIVLGAVVGHFWPSTGEALKPLGDGFIKLVKMVIAPVIFLTLVSGIAGLRELRTVGRVAAKAFGYFLFFSTLALIIGLFVGNVVQPGAGMNVDPATLDASPASSWQSSPTPSCRP